MVIHSEEVTVPSVTADVMAAAIAPRTATKNFAYAELNIRRFYPESGRHGRGDLNPQPGVLETPALAELSYVRWNYE